MGINYAGTFVIFIALHGEAQAALSVIGEAFELSADKLVYTEVHSYSDDLLQHQVVYTAADNTELAVKQLNYSHGFTAPSFVQHNRVLKEFIQVGFVDQQLSMVYSAAGSGSSRTQKEKSMLVTSPLVIDAGFDYYIREHWQPLIAGQVLTFEFVVPARQSLVTLKAQQTACSYSASDDVCFTIGAANWLIRLVLAPIELGYEASRQRLSRYRGLANMSDQEGRVFKVDIHYRYIDRCQHDRDCQLLQQAPVLSGFLMK